MVSGEIPELPAFGNETKAIFYEKTQSIEMDAYVHGKAITPRALHNRMSVLPGARDPANNYRHQDDQQ